jgi:hypothetical protein
MSTAVYGAPLEVEEGETLSLTTTPQYLAVKPGFKEVKMYCASQWRVAHSPRLAHVLYYAASAGTYTDYIAEATDKSTATHVPLDAMPDTDYLYLGFVEPSLGFYAVIDSTNKNDVAATLDVEYSSTAVAQGATLAFTDVTGESDGTDVSGDTLKQSGVYTWTLPSAWKRTTLGTFDKPLYGQCYWIRFCPDATLSTEIDIQSIVPVYQNANYGYREPGIEYQWTINVAKTGGFVLLATAGNPTLDITWIRHS